MASGNGSTDSKFTAGNVLPADQITSLNLKPAQYTSTQVGGKKRKSKTTKIIQKGCGTKYHGGNDGALETTTLLPENMGGKKSRKNKKSVKRSRAKRFWFF